MVQIPAESQLARAAVAPDKVDGKATLGYAYLRELASEAYFTCTWIGQHSDGWGVDVRLDVHEELDPQARLKDFALDFQLRVTSRGLPVVDGKLQFFLEADRYETLRSATPERPRFLVLLSLPTDFGDSYALSAEDLVVHRSGRWLCLSGAPQASNTTSTPVRFPTWNVLTPAALREIARRVALGSRFFHEQ
jgi:hypothetical protein